MNTESPFFACYTWREQVLETFGQDLAEPSLSELIPAGATVWSAGMLLTIAENDVDRFNTEV